MGKLTRRQLSATVAPAVLRAQPAKRPNLLFLLSDDHTAEFTGCYGNTTIRTPNLDRFASEGIRFDRMFTTAPQCVPSRVSLMTGISPVAARMGRFSAPLPANVPALPDFLRKAGYYTGVCRRNHHLDGSPNGPVSGPIYKKHGLATMRNRFDFLNVDRRRELTGPIAEEFFSKRPQGKPFFLWVNFEDPHHPWDRDALTPPHDRKTLRVPKFLPDLPGVREDLGRYYDEIGRMDSEFQTVLDILQRTGEAENTLVVFMGDNGCPFPHGKGTLYDPGIHVPCMARWPGVIQPGRSSSALLSGEDLTPTFLEAAGVPVPESMSGVSFRALLDGSRMKTRDRIFAARLTHGGRPFKEGTTTHTFDLSRAVRNDRFKLIYNCTPQMRYSPVDSYTERSWIEMGEEHYWGRLPAAMDKAYYGARPVMELYDLEADPVEMSNLAGRPGLAAVQRELTVAMQEKMILDWDFLPLPLNE